MAKDVKVGGKAKKAAPKTETRSENSEKVVAGDMVDVVATGNGSFLRSGKKLRVHKILAAKLRAKGVVK